MFLYKLRLAPADDTHEISRLIFPEITKRYPNYVVSYRPSVTDDISKLQNVSFHRQIRLDIS